MPAPTVRWSGSIDGGLHLIYRNASLEKIAEKEKLAAIETRLSNFDI
jgi:hypothetical protein